MTTETETPDPAPVSPVGAFTRGFLARVLYGAMGIAVVVLVRPDLLGENRHVLLGASAAYLLVCLAGGVVDAIRGAPRTPGRRRGLRPADAGWLLLFVAALVLLWLGR